MITPTLENKHKGTTELQMCSKIHTDYKLSKKLNAMNNFINMAKHFVEQSFFKEMCP